jgi:hypothetical protein
MSWGRGIAYEQLFIKEVKKDNASGTYTITADKYTETGKVTETFTVTGGENNGLVLNYDGESTLFVPDTVSDHRKIDSSIFAPEGYSTVLGSWGEVRSLYLNGDIYIAVKEDDDGRLVATKGKWSDSSAAKTAYIVGASSSAFESYIITLERTVEGKMVHESFAVNTLMAATLYSSDYELMSGAYFEDSYADHPDTSKLQKLTDEEIQNAWGYLRSAGGDEWSDYYITLVKSTDDELWADLSTWSEGKIFSQVRIIGVWKDNWTGNGGKFYVIVQKNIGGNSALFYITGSAIDMDTIMTLYFKGAVTMGSPLIDLPTTSFIMDNADDHSKFGSGEFHPFYKKWNEIISQWGNVRTNERNTSEYIVVGGYFGGRLLARKYDWQTGAVLGQAYIVGVRADWRYKSYVVTCDILTDAGYVRNYITIMNGSTGQHSDIYAWTIEGVNSIYFEDSFSNH